MPLRPRLGAFLIAAAAACSGGAGDGAADGADTGAAAAAGAAVERPPENCTPLDTAERNAPAQQPAFPEQTRACGLTTDTSAYQLTVVATGLVHPWAVEPLPGGDLRLRWDQPTNHVLKTGPAVEVFNGEWNG